MQYEPWSPEVGKAPGFLGRFLYDDREGEGLVLVWHEGGNLAGPVAAPMPGHDVVELCLNLEGMASLRVGRNRVVLPPRHACFHLGTAGGTAPTMTRRPQDTHRFLMVGFSFDYLRRHLQGCEDRLCSPVAALVSGAPLASELGGPFPLTGRTLELVAGLREPPVAGLAREVWYRGKAMELVAEFLFRHEEGDGLFCSRRRQLARERTERARALLRENLDEPLSLDELARRVGCSSHYLSRTFSSEAGCTLSHYLRQLRMERAAELLRSGRFNVTETALEVGYSSLSHFIQAFQEAYGCLPGSYAQAADKK